MRVRYTTKKKIVLHAFTNVTTNCTIIISLYLFGVAEARVQNTKIDTKDSQYCYNVISIL